MKDVLTVRDKIVYRIRDICSSLYFRKTVFPEGVSFLVIVKDREETIRDCLLSILPIANEIIVVDSSTKDNTSFIIRELSADNKKIRHFQYPYRDMLWGEFFVETLNYGLKQCRFRWVFKWDSDQIADTKGVKLWIQRAKTLSKGRFCVVDVSRLTNNVLGGFEGRLYTQNYIPYKVWRVDKEPVRDSIIFPLWFKLIRFTEPYITHHHVKWKG
ncbi:MAG: glycosyltransferase [Candidatus Bathyarchaeia archaeon]|jgi:glycosyltransferase involved in cell wall biosynthesis